MVANVVVRWEYVENGCEYGKRQAWTVRRRRCNGCRKVLTYFGKEFVEVWRLSNKVYEKVVCSNELYTT